MTQEILEIIIRAAEKAKFPIPWEPKAQRIPTILDADLFIQALKEEMKMPPHEEGDGV